MTKYWSAVQGVSALFFSAFLALHLGSAAAASWSPAFFDRYLLVVRPVYQHPLVEPLVFGSIVAHLVAGWLKPKPVNRPLSRRGWHVWTGYILTLFVGGHTFATRFSGAEFLFNGVSYTAQRLPYLFLPYYTVYGIAGVVHLCHGLPLAASMTAAPFPSLRPWIRRIPLFRRQPSILVAAFSVFVFLGVLGLGGFLYPYTIDRSDRHIVDFDHHIALVRNWTGFSL